MKQEMNMTVNRLPARTWNWLKMNESRIAGVFIENNNPAAVQLSGEGLSSCAADTAGGDGADFWKQDTGMGPDMDRLMDGAGVNAQFVTAKEGRGAGALAELIYTLAPGGKSGSRLYLHAKKNSELNVAVLYEAAGGSGQAAEGGLAALQTKIYAEAGAKVRLYMAQTLPDNVLCLNDIGAACEDGAQVELVRLELGAGKLFAGCEVALDGVKSGFEARIGYAGRPGQRLDMNYTARHRGKKTESLMEVDGILSEGTFKIFRGTIDLLPGCSGAKGTETENVLLLGDHVVNQTIPLILCGEEDVEGNHGATIGKLDDQMLFYLSSRGIPKEAAEQMIARARVDALCARFPSEKIREKMEAFLGSAEEEGGEADGAEL